MKALHRALAAVLCGSPLCYSQVKVTAVERITECRLQNGATAENLRGALEMEADRMVSSRLAQKDLDSEMTVVRNEFESGENNPGRILMQRVMSTAFVWHAYGED